MADEMLIHHTKLSVINEYESSEQSDMDSIDQIQHQTMDQHTNDGHDDIERGRTRNRNENIDGGDGGDSECAFDSNQEKENRPLSRKELLMLWKSEKMQSQKRAGGGGVAHRVADVPSKKIPQSQSHTSTAKIPHSKPQPTIALADVNQNTKGVTVRSVNPQPGTHSTKPVLVKAKSLDHLQLYKHQSSESANVTQSSTVTTRKPEDQVKRARSTSSKSGKQGTNASTTKRRKKMESGNNGNSAPGAVSLPNELQEEDDHTEASHGTAIADNHEETFQRDSESPFSDIEVIQEHNEIDDLTLHAPPLESSQSETVAVGYPHFDQKTLSEILLEREVLIDNLTRANEALELRLALETQRRNVLEEKVEQCGSQEMDVDVIGGDGDLSLKVARLEEELIVAVCEGERLRRENEALRKRVRDAVEAVEGCVVDGVGEGREGNGDGHDGRVVVEARRLAGLSRDLVREVVEVAEERPVCRAKLEVMEETAEVIDGVVESDVPSEATTEDHRTSINICRILIDEIENDLVALLQGEGERCEGDCEEKGHCDSDVDAMSIGSGAALEDTAGVEGIAGESPSSELQNALTEADNVADVASWDANSPDAMVMHDHDVPTSPTQMASELRDCYEVIDVLEAELSVVNQKLEESNGKLKVAMESSRESEQQVLDLEVMLHASTSEVAVRDERIKEAVDALNETLEENHELYQKLHGMPDTTTDVMVQTQSAGVEIEIQTDIDYRQMQRYHNAIENAKLLKFAVKVAEQQLAELAQSKDAMIGALKNELTESSKAYQSLAEELQSVQKRACEAVEKVMKKMKEREAESRAKSIELNIKESEIMRLKEIIEERDGEADSGATDVEL
ncbi:hypothetical protein HDU76_013260 [Blyttiomyces sp. JEL0837]|nr:hypothetical protein HDU76_013260 [Blyttiomyces sp. JEL0837]